MIKKKIFFIPLIVSSVLFSDPPNWDLNIPDYQYNGSVTSAVYLNDEIVGCENDILAGFVGDEVRGIINGLFFPPTGDYSFNLLLYSNSSAGETMTFKFYHAESDQVFDLSETLDFESDMIIGNALTNPFIFNGYGDTSGGGDDDEITSNLC